jgi:hypothetical protein
VCKVRPPCIVGEAPRFAFPIDSAYPHGPGTPDLFRFPECAKSVPLVYGRARVVSFWFSFLEHRKVSGEAGSSRSAARAGQQASAGAAGGQQAAGCKNGVHRYD